VNVHNFDNPLPLYPDKNITYPFTRITILPQGIGITTVLGSGVSITTMLDDATSLDMCKQYLTSKQVQQDNIRLADKVRKTKI